MKNKRVVLNTFKAVFISFLLSVIVFISFDVFIISRYYRRPVSFSEYINIYHTIPVDEYFERLYAGETIENASISKFRPDENINSKLKPILFMGCSFTYGDWLEDYETVSAKTALLTKRPVYNSGGSGWGLDQLVYQLRREDLMKTVGGGKNLNF